jgi:pimeloyl-ACP methyl ester carboxylesterase
LRGFGGSSSGDWPGSAEPSLDRYADDVIGLIDVLGLAPPVTIVGFSMGGYVALNLLRRSPGRLDAVALMDTLATADDETQRGTRLKMAEGVGEWGAARVAELMRPKLFGPVASQQTIDETVAVISASDPRAIAAAQRAMAVRPDSTPLLPSIAIPTLVVVGADDAISPVGKMQAIADLIPRARFEVIQGAGHMAPLERPAAVNAALRSFLESV